MGRFAAVRSNAILLALTSFDCRRERLDESLRSPY
ncbi:hypothetical protein BCAR13_440107 [Paraburkholderia caribensis]|nr:hypothetical protein BCAR13_440107 [Paraburkholderia caribensis]